MSTITANGVLAKSSNVNSLPAYPRLIADIGGTNARFALEVAPQDIKEVKALPCRDFFSIQEAVKSYLASTGTQVKDAAFAIANPVTSDWIQMTNHHWAFSLETLRQDLELHSLLAINDFTAQALAIAHLKDEELLKIGGGVENSLAPKVVLGPGTGLGMGIVLPNKTAIATEGGHVSFAPFDEREMYVLERAKERFGHHVSAERLLCGSGLVLLYELLAAKAGEWQDKLEPKDVLELAFLRGDPRQVRCREALDSFCAMLGSFAANAALSTGARGGVYICGGIVPRFCDYFAKSAFRVRFEDKGRMESYLSACQSFVVLAKNPGLIGAAAALE